MTTDAALPDLSGGYALTPEQIARYQQDGYTLPHVVWSPE